MEKHLTPIVVDDTTIIKSYIFKNEYNEWVLKIKYPSVGRSHFYSMANNINNLFDEQYPEWATILHKQSRGEI